MNALNVENNKKKTPDQNLKSLIYKNSKVLLTYTAQTSRKVAPEAKTESGIVRHVLSSPTVRTFPKR